MAFTGQRTLKLFHLQKNVTPQNNSKALSVFVDVHFAKGLRFPHLLTSHCSFHLACKIDAAR